jgi:CRISPR system Cascade subunit CasE
VETRQYEPRLQQDEVLRFELRANPVVTKNGKKHDIVMDAQQTLLKLLCEKLNLLPDLPGTPEKKAYKSALLSHGGQQLDNRLTAILENDCRYAERLGQKLTLREKLEWASRAEVDNTLDEWMTRQGKQNGFTIVKDNHGNLKLQNSAYQWHALTGKAAKGEKSGFSAVDFTGDLVVADVEAFKKALFNGIGRSKAFGCGLMLVKRI